MARKLAVTHGLGGGDVIVDRARLDELQGALYCLEAAIEDVERDIAGRPTARDLREALDWLLANARPAAACWIEARPSDPLDFT